MRAILLPILASMCCACAQAAPQELSDSELSSVTGGDGISFAFHLELNQPLAGSTNDSRLSIGNRVDGQNNYIVFRNFGGIVDMFAINLSTHSAPDGTSYVALGLPTYVKFNNFGFQSLSVQADPLAPVTQSLGSITLNGTMSMQGELRFWAH
jgi:hypothetical protein